MLRRTSGLIDWLPLAILLCVSSCRGILPSSDNKTGPNDNRPRIFSPRMDYDEWTPLGRGDPLKNNPTFDYVPPVLDRVQYWLDSHTTEASAKRDILVLGVTAKKTSPKIPEQFLKFVDGPKFTRLNIENSYNRNDYTGSAGAEPPKLVRTSSFRNGPVDYRNRIQSIPSTSYYSNSYYNQRTKPYTMMLPPPINQKPSLEPSSTSYNVFPTQDKVYSYETPQQFSTQTEEGSIVQDSQYYGPPSKLNNYQNQPSKSYSQGSIKSPSKGSIVSQIETIKSIYTPATPQTSKPRYESTTSPSVSFEKSNLIYQSTQTLTGGWLGADGSTSSSSSITQEPNQVTWKTPEALDSRDWYEVDHHGSASSNHEVVIGQNANIIVDGDSAENEEVVVGQQEFKIPVTDNSTVTIDFTSNHRNHNLENSTQKMHIVLAHSSSPTMDFENQKQGPIALVMPTNYNTEESIINATTPQHLETSTNAPKSIFNHTVTMEMDKSTNEPSKIQPPRNVVSSSPVSAFIEELPMSPNRIGMTTNHIQPGSSSVIRFPGSPPPHMFGPQMMSQPVQQSRPSSMMQFMRPPNPGNIGFRPPAPMSMNHMSPLMSHSMNPTIEHSHSGRPTQNQAFSMTFANPSSVPLNSIFQKEHYSPSIAITTADSIVSMLDTSTVTHSLTKTPQPAPLIKILNNEEASNTKINQFTSTIPPDTTSSKTTITTTTVPNLTTDPIFSHYKQPAKPIRGPLYLIIQGHSKVKTYKPTVNKHVIPLENNEILDNVTERQLTKLEQLIRDNTKNSQNVVEKQKYEGKVRSQKQRNQAGQENLMSFIDNGLRGFTLSPLMSFSSNIEDKSQVNSINSTIEINAN